MKGRQHGQCTVPLACSLCGTVGETARASLLDRVGQCQATLGQYSAAGTTHRQALSLREKNLRKKHIQTLLSINEVGLALKNQGGYEAAEAVNRQTLALFKTELGRKHPDTLTSMNNLAGVLDSQGKYQEAEAINRQTLALKETMLGPEHPSTLTSMSDIKHIRVGLSTALRGCLSCIRRLYRSQKGS
jgi:tetratricopeptide (TPR) repeat protein